MQWQQGTEQGAPEGVQRNEVLLGVRDLIQGW
jgi:hypothetical protein